MEVRIENAIESKLKTVKAQGNTGRIYLPSTWVGRKVQVVLLEEENE